MANIKVESNSEEKYQNSKSRVCIGVDVRMPCLIDGEQNENGDGVHEGSVELEVRVVWAHVITSTHDPQKVQ